MSTVLIDVGDGTLIAPPPAALEPSTPTAPPPPATTTATTTTTSSASAPIPQPGQPLIDLGDGTTIVAPSVAPPPATAPTALAPALPEALAPTVPGQLPIGTIPQPGHPLIDLGDVLGPSVLIEAPPVVDTGSGGSGGGGGTGGGVGGTDDLATSSQLALANVPDLANLPPWELVDPFGLQELAVTNPALKGGGALAAIAQACSDYGVDTIAAVADAMHEGANGRIGDGGLAYGPFQDHLTEFADRPFFGKGRNNPVVNAWAWSENGIRYSVRAMVNSSPSARGLRGHAAVYAIVYGYERPADKPGAYKTRAAEYDVLVSKGSGWAAYAAPFFNGPQAGGAVDTKPLAPPAQAAYKPAGTAAQWRSFIDVFRLTLPAKREQVTSLASSLKEVFR